MFIGHLGVALALKRVDKTLSLGLLFIAVQLVDMIFIFNILLGIERVNLISGTTAASSLEYVYYPFSHGLVANLVWAGAIYIIFRMIPTKSSSPKSRVALVMGVAVLSHFLLDVIVHNPDLPLFGDNSYKVGLGLWNYALASYVVEGLFLLGGLWIYLKSTTGKTFAGKYGMTIFTLYPLTLSAMIMFGPPMPNIEVGTMLLLMFYLLSTGIAFWLDRKRS